MSQKKVRVIIIGAGNWAATAHIPAIQHRSDAEVVGITKRDTKAAHKMADDFSIPYASNDLEALIAESKPDAAIISSVAAFHYEQSKVALSAGLHTLIEKPMTFTVSESEGLQQIADQKRLHFLVSCPWHYSPHAIEARRLVQSGALGRIKMISQLFTNFGLGLYKGLSWDQIFGNFPNPQNLDQPYVPPGINSYSDPALAGGGQIYCQVSHAAAFLAFLTSSQPVEVFARFDFAGLKQDVYDVLNLKFENGILVSMASCLLPMFSDRQHEVRVFGSEGMLLIELWKGKMELHDMDSQVHCYPDLSEEEAYPILAPAENLVDTILGKAPNGSPATLGLAAMRVIEAACESNRTGKNIFIRPT
jgi:predicted dehydrogenase